VYTTPATDLLLVEATCDSMWKTAAQRLWAPLQHARPVPVKLRTACSLGQPRSTGRLVLAGRPHRANFPHRCDSIHITWKAPSNVGGWSPVTDYAVFIEATELVPFEDSLPIATDDAAVRALPHKVAYCVSMCVQSHSVPNPCRTYGIRAPEVHTCAVRLGHIVRIVYRGITGGLPANQPGSDGPRTFHRVHGYGATAKRQGLGISVE
jgi:hypothetical protein